MKIEQAHLESMAASAARIANDRSPLPACAGARLRFNGAAFHVEATDLRRRVLMRWPDVVAPRGSEPWEAIVSARGLLAAAQVMPPGKPVRVMPEREGVNVSKIRISSGIRERVITTFAAAWPEAWEPPVLDGALEIEGAALLRLISGVSWAADAVPVSAERLWTSGVRFRWSPEKITASATNCKVLMSLQIAGSGKPGSGDISLPIAAAKAIGFAGAKATDDDAAALEVAPSTTVRIAANERLIRVETTTGTLLAGSIGQAGDLPPPVLSGQRFVLARDALLDVAKSMRGFHSFTITAAHGEAVITAEDETSRALDKLPLAEPCTDLAVELIPAQIVSALNKLECDEVAIVDGQPTYIFPHPIDPCCGSLAWVAQLGGRS